MEHGLLRRNIAHQIQYGFATRRYEEYNSGYMGFTFVTGYDRVTVLHTYVSTSTLDVWLMISTNTR